MEDSTNIMWLNHIWEKPESVTAVGTFALAIISLFGLVSLYLLRSHPRRKPVPRLSAILKKGITIQTFSPDDTFTTESVNTGGFWRLVAHIERAHAESKRKSDLAKANWKQKRKRAEQDGHKLTSRCPAWLNLEKGQFIRNPEAVKTIRRIFKLKLEGFGKLAIEKKLNEGAEWQRKNGWRASYIEKILNNRAVIGDYQSRSADKSVGCPFANLDSLPNNLKGKDWTA